LDRLSVGVLSVALHACPPKGALRGHQPILPHDDDAFRAVQLLLVQELLM
jgi:hypothetical protein